MFYLLQLSSSFLCFIFTFKDSFKFQFNLFFMLTLASFSRFSQNLLNQLIILFQVKSDLVLEFFAIIDNLGIFFGFMVYMTLVLFWAEQYYKRLKSSDYSNRRVNVIFYFAISIFLLFIFCFGILFLAIPEFSPESLLYRVIRLLLRFISTTLIIFGLVYFGFRLFQTIRQSEFPEHGMKSIYQKLGVISIVCTSIYCIFLFYNFLTFILGGIWIEFEYKWFFKNISASLESLGFFLIIFVCRPKIGEFCFLFEKYNQPIVFQDDDESEFENSNLIIKEEETLFVE
jgi:hypothetical protein